ncbi:hypothetical protein F2Q69_00037747 [Brassica cretica]|uniref:Uncharacterized protein n=1 Tax=Brassica cretica TaxID=69181 RepID=A0A8S9SNE8_BRACR|nr:hypothetical protein F2Q69_00037747 [Brassica cretica]
MEEVRCSIPVPQSELDQSKVGLIRRDRHVGHVIWMPRKMAGTVTKLPEQLQDGPGGVTGETLKDGYRLIRNRPRAFTDWMGVERDTGAEYVLSDQVMINAWFWGAKHD